MSTTQIIVAVSWIALIILVVLLFGAIAGALLGSHMREKVEELEREEEKHRPDVCYNGTKLLIWCECDCLYDGGHPVCPKCGKEKPETR